MQPFTVSREAYLAVWKWYFIAAPLGVFGSYLFNPNSSLLSLAISALIVGTVVCIGYRTALRYVWVRVSSAGMFGKGETGRDLEIGWHETVYLLETSKFGFKGVSVRRVEDDGLQTRKTSTLFIPAPVLAQAEFRQAVRRYAGSGHPLNEALNRAI